MEEQIYNIIAGILAIASDELELNLDNRDIWNSLQRVEVLFAIEDEFGISFSEEALIELNTPRKLCNAAIDEAAK